MQKKVELHSGGCGDIRWALPYSGAFLVALPTMEQYSSHLPVPHIHFKDPNIIYTWILSSLIQIIQSQIF